MQLPDAGAGPPGGQQRLLEQGKAEEAGTFKKKAKILVCNKITLQIKESKELLIPLD